MSQRRQQSSCCRRNLPWKTLKTLQGLGTGRRRFALAGTGRAVAAPGAPRRRLYLPLSVFGFPNLGFPFVPLVFLPLTGSAVFMLENQKQPVWLAAASWWIKHEAAVTTKPGPPHAPTGAHARRADNLAVSPLNNSMQTGSDLNINQC